MGFAREAIPKVESGERTPSDDVYAAWLQACRCSAELRANLDDQLGMFVTVGLDEDTAAKKAAARVKRQSILEGPEATCATFIVFEPILHRMVGTAEVTAKQMAHLLKMTNCPSVVIQVVRDPGEYFPGLRAQFEIASGRKIPVMLNMI
jgi:Domain of unknown function (DUF5753)